MPKKIMFPQSFSALTPPKGFFKKGYKPSSFSLRPLKKSLGFFPNQTKKLFGDNDKDGVFNFFDCKINNPKKHGGELYWQQLKKDKIDVSQLSPKERKIVRRTFEKRPELLDKAYGLTIKRYKNNEEKAIASLAPGQRGTDDVLYVSEGAIRSQYGNKSKIYKPKNKQDVFGQILSHELKHRTDAYDKPKMLYKGLKQARDLEYEAHERYETNNPMNYSEYRKRYNELPHEKRALKEQVKPRERDIKNKGVPTEAVNYVLQDTDGDGVNDAMDCDPNDKTKQDWDYGSAAEQATYVVHMAPQQYLRMTGVSGDPRKEKFLQTYDDTNTGREEPIEKLQEHIKNPNKKVSIPYLEGPESVNYGFNKGFREHEGRHRAYAAYLAGEKTIPVRVPIPKKERKLIGKEFAKTRVSYGGDPSIRDLRAAKRKSYREKISKEQFPQWAFDSKEQNIYRDILQKKGMIPTESYTSAMYQDWDKDGVNNLMDCDPNDPDKQGAIHQGFAYLFHGTKKSRLPKIKKEGLQPTKNYWGDPVVFLTPSREAAKYYASKNNTNAVLRYLNPNVKKEEGVVLSVKVPRDELKDYSDNDIIKEHFYKQIKVGKPIHPNNVSVYKYETQNKLLRDTDSDGVNNVMDQYPNNNRRQ